MGLVLLPVRATEVNAGGNNIRPGTEVKLAMVVPSS